MLELIGAEKLKLKISQIFMIFLYIFRNISKSLRSRTVKAKVLKKLIQFSTEMIHTKISITQTGAEKLEKQVEHNVRREF